MGFQSLLHGETSKNKPNISKQRAQLSGTTTLDYSLYEHPRDRQVVV